MKAFRRIILKHDLFNPILPVFILPLHLKDEDDYFLVTLLASSFSPCSKKITGQDRLDAQKDHHIDCEY